MSHSTAKKQSLLARVRRIGGQISAIERALQEEAGCSTLLHQAAGARGAINGLLDEIIADHLMEHVVRPGLTTQLGSPALMRFWQRSVVTVNRSWAA